MTTTLPGTTTVDQPRNANHYPNNLELHTRDIYLLPPRERDHQVGTSERTRVLRLRKVLNGVVDAGRNCYDEWWNSTYH